MSKNKLLSPTQKGFRNNVSGCVEHQFLLSKLIENARKNSKQELVVLTDLADAFGSIRHFALEHYGLDQELRIVIKSLFTDLSVSLELNGETDQITQEKGVFQGLPFADTLRNKRTTATQKDAMPLGQILWHVHLKQLGQFVRK